jgi:hypothetical protein
LSDCLSQAGADPELSAIAKAWPDLPADVRKMILGVVKATLAAKR